MSEVNATRDKALHRLRGSAPLYPGSASCPCSGRHFNFLPAADGFLTLLYVCKLPSMEVQNGEWQGCIIEDMCIGQTSNATSTYNTN